MPTIGSDDYSLHQVAGQQEVCDALANGVLMSAVAADQLTLRDLCLQEEVMKILEGLFVLLKLLGRRRLGRQFGESKLAASQYGDQK
jgi:hypothetical protein